MNDLQIFNNEEFGEIRALEIDGQPWFIGKDVAVALGYSNTRDAIKKHVDADDKGVANCDTLGGRQKMTIINESGLYSLILGSDLESAKKFKHWVTSEVLPSIRKTGSYETPKVKEHRETLASVNNAVKIITPFLVNAGCSENIQLLTVKTIYEKARIEIPIDIKADQKFYSTEYIARELGMKTNSGKPAIGAVNEIIRKIGYSEDEYEVVYFENHGHQGTTNQYSQSVIDRVAEWLSRNNNPVNIDYVDKSGRDKAHHVIYS